MSNQRLLMGNEAMALGAIRAGVRLVAGYPGTPSTEILETAARENDGSFYVEWSVNEKAAMEVAAGAAYTGARVLVTMKQVGLNVASDPLMSLAYVGVKGGMVVVAADDPGPISSQTEQDTRHFAAFAKLPVFDPSSPEEAYLMMADAFAVSEKYGTPVLMRPTTRVCHGCASVALLPKLDIPKPEGFIKDQRWVIFPRLSYQNHIKIEARQPVLAEELSALPYSCVTGNQNSRLGVVTGGISYEYVMETPAADDVKVLKIGTPHPFPEKLALEFLSGLESVLVIEELDPVIERSLLELIGKHHLSVTVKGKLTGDTKNAGENSVESVRADIKRFLGRATEAQERFADRPALPVRPPVLCAGCPHRASFYAVKRAARGKKAVFCGDIGCYTLGNAQPLDMVDTCLCMGADVTIAQGIGRMEPDTLSFAFIGDSTFFASGLTGIVNAVYNKSDMILIVLDNSTTAMTGQQPHPGTGETMMDEVSENISIEQVLRGIGLDFVEQADPLNHKSAVDSVKRAIDGKGVRAVIFKSPCIAKKERSPLRRVNVQTCNGCKTCIKQLGCPAISEENGTVSIEPSLCYGCNLCAQICPKVAIAEVNGDE